MFIKYSLSFYTNDKAIDALSVNGNTDIEMLMKTVLKKVNSC